jgi:hypothetical protein
LSNLIKDLAKRTKLETNHRYITKATQALKFIPIFNTRNSLDIVTCLESITDILGIIDEELLERTLTELSEITFVQLLRGFIPISFIHLLQNITSLFLSIRENTGLTSTQRKIISLTNKTIQECFSKFMTTIRETIWKARNDIVIEWEKSIHIYAKHKRRLPRDAINVPRPQNHPVPNNIANNVELGEERDTVSDSDIDEPQDPNPPPHNQAPPGLNYHYEALCYNHQTYLSTQPLNYLFNARLNGKWNTRAPAEELDLLLQSIG